MDKQSITGNGGTSYTLDHAVANVNEIEVFVNNVRQEPSVAYTVAGTALTMTGNVASSDDFYVVFQGKALQTVVPPDGSVTSAKLASGAAASNLGTSVNLATIKDSTGTNTAMTIDSSGNVIATNYIRQTNPIAFSAKSNSGGQAYNNQVLPFSIENFDIGGNYNNTTYRFVAPVDGIYHFDATIHSTSSASSPLWIRKNGTNYLRGYHGSASGGYEGQVIVNVNMQLSANDYVDCHSGGNANYYLVAGYNEFSGFLIG